ncbi:hypothetical protein D3C81_592340 [compost metagenome]
MRRGGHGGDPGADVGHGVGRSRVAGGGRNEHARIRGMQKGLFDGIVDGTAAADRIVDHVHAILHGFFDRRHAVAAVAAVLRARRLGGQVVRPADLVDGQAGTWRHAGNRAQARAVRRHGHARIAARGGRGVRAVAAFAARVAHGIARRGEFAPVLDLVRFGQPHGIEVLRAQQLVVAVVGAKAFARLADAFPGGRRRAIGQAGVRIEGGGAVGVDPVRIRQVFRPHAAIDDADDDVFARVLLAAQLAPQPARLVQAQEGWRVVRLQGARLVGSDAGHVAAGLQLAHFGVGQQGGKAIEDDLVLVLHRGGGDQGLDPGLLLFEVVAVQLHFRAGQVEAAAGGRLGGAQAFHRSGVGSDWFIGQLHDVGAAQVIGVGLDAQAGKQAQHG